MYRHGWYNEHMKEQAVIIYGPPGSGKGTQADLLVRRFNFIHFDTGRYLEGYLHAPAAAKSRMLRRERILWDTGKLNTPAWVLGIVKAETKKVARAGMSIVFSGSPRTTFEAFGDRRGSGLMALLNSLYGKKNVTVLWLTVAERTAMRRNGARLVCSVCGLPILASAKSRHCAFCAGPMRRRTLDDPSIIKVRLKEYRNRTYPIIAEMRQRGYRVLKIPAERVPYRVFEHAVRALSLSRRV